METKQCRQCGEVKPIDQFRKYYEGRGGHYTYCLDCERINTRCKYLTRKKALKPEEQTELNVINELLEAQRAAGFKPPMRGATHRPLIISDLTSQIEKLRASTVSGFEGEPIELQTWLTNELIEAPDYYLDKIYEDLKAHFRPMIAIGGENTLPVYDEAHKDILDKILERFNNYEDEYYEKT